MHQLMTSLYIVILFVLLPLINADCIDQGQCPYKVHGNVPDTNADVDEVIKMNNVEILPLLHRILTADFFKFFKVNLNRGCQFWIPDWECALRDCHVKDCDLNTIPDGLKSAECEEDAILSSVDKTITVADQSSIDRWTKHDHSDDGEFCELGDEHDANAIYFDLLINPERYTGYKGPSAHKIWNSVYKENCFQDQPVYGSQNKGSQCLEKRAFYRMVSGLHTSINTHLSYSYLLPQLNMPKSIFSTDQQFGPNLYEFRQRFHPDNEPESAFRIMNLYFTYIMELKALYKIVPYLRRQSFYTGNVEKDNETRELMHQLLNLIEAKGNLFDETLLFREPSDEVHELKREFRNHFRNISRIMDCVGCDKCRLWGKIQTQGMGTSLKILFHGQGQTRGSSNNNNDLAIDYKLRRSEIVSLLNAFGRLSNSILAIERFCDMEQQPDQCSAPPKHTEL